jgi:hypothetical protein
VAVLEVRKPGHIPSGSREAVDEARTDRIGDLNEYNRHCAGRLQQRRHARCPRGHDDVRCKRDQFGSVFANFFGITTAPAMIDLNVAAVGPARLLERL